MVETTTATTMVAVIVTMIKKSGNNRQCNCDQDKCPFHPEARHSWLNCFANPNGHQFKPHFAARMAKAVAKNHNPSRSNRQKQVGGDRINAHVHDDGEANDSDATNAHMSQQTGKAQCPSCEPAVNLRLCPGLAILSGNHRALIIESSAHVFVQIGPQSEMKVIHWRTRTQM
jgi:hypothetical protein